MRSRSFQPEIVVHHNTHVSSLLVRLQAVEAAVAERARAPPPPDPGSNPVAETVGRGLASSLANLAFVLREKLKFLAALKV